jgi:hypothetical protein
MSKAFVWADADGALRAVSSFCGDFDPACDPDNPDTVHPYAQELRNEFITKQGLVACYAVECGCDPEEEPLCRCGAEAVRDCYVNNGVLTAKPAMTLKLAGQSIQSGVMQDRTPGSSAQFKIECAVPDGHQIELLPYQAAITQSAPVTLTFTNGVSNEVSVTTPAQGLVGGLAGMSKFLGNVILILRGWA